MIRAFIAIELKDKNTIEKIHAFSSRLKQNQPKLKVVEPENLHMTVKFLGNISESVAPKIYEILKEDINKNLFQGKEIEYSLRGVGQFNKFSVLWVKLIGDVQFLQQIKDTIEQLLSERLKIQKDKRTGFKPHLTIGRLRKDKVNYQNFSALKNLINENQNFEFGPFIVSQVKLKKSILTPTGPTYSDLVY
ncbi:MAG: RNA 2',3'-cyclic phosphodiesterase [Promethearchaeota archaeon]